MTTIPLALSSLTGSSDRPGSIGRAVHYHAEALSPEGALPYLVLLRAGFCLPPGLPRARCALTAPFHPYSPSPSGPGRALTGYGAARPSKACRTEARGTRGSGRYVFCATVLQVALTGSYPAHCPAEFGLSSTA